MRAVIRRISRLEERLEPDPEEELLLAVVTVRREDRKVKKQAWAKLSFLRHLSGIEIENAFRERMPYALARLALDALGMLIESSDQEPQ
jgi:archaellum biogenesis protein FlaJ (TadC family)